MLKLILIGILLFGAFIALITFFPSSTTTAFNVGTHAIPWFALGLLVIGYIGWKKIAS